MDLSDFFGDEDGSPFKSMVRYPDCAEYTMDELLHGEKEMLGLYVSGHPLDKYSDIINEYANVTSVDFMFDDETGTTSAKDRMTYTMGCIIEKVNVKLTRKNETMAFLTVSDLVGTMEIIVFPKAYTDMQNDLYPGNAVLITGRSSITEEEAKLIAENIRLLDDIRQDMEAAKIEVWVRFSDYGEYKNNEQDLISIAKEFPGKSPLFVQLAREKQAKKMKVEVDADSTIAGSLGLAFGDANVLIRKK